MRVFVLGGTGFLGTPVVDALLRDGHRVVALARDPRRLRRRNGLEPVVGDITRPHTFRGRALGCAASIHMVGLLRGSKADFEKVVVRGTRAWVQECKESGVKHLVYVSAIGADPEGTPYQRSKWSAEQAVRNSGLSYTILRPSFVIGPGGFLQQMLGVLGLRIVPVFGRQNYLASPVARDDLVEAIVKSLTTRAARKRVLHVGGPDDLTYVDMLRTISREAKIRALFPRLPKWMGYAAAYAFGWLHFFPATPDNLRMLFEGNVAAEHEWEDLFDIRARTFQVAVREALATIRSR